MKRQSFLATVLKIMLIFAVGSIFPAGAQTVSSFTKEADGALCLLSNGSKLKLQVCAGNIIRVVYTSQATIPNPQGLIVGKTSFTPGTWDASDNGTAIVVTTPKVTATVTKSNSVVSFATPTGTAICSEVTGGRTMAAVTKSGQAGFSGTLQFNSPAGEGVYGLGQLSLGSPAWGTASPTGAYWEVAPPDRNGVLNVRDFTFDMHQSNWYDVIPFFMTTSGYGILMNFCCHATKTAPLSFAADFLLNNAWDYFFIYGPQFDTIISGYRDVTGPAPMLPKWAYGWWQCKNAYGSSSEIQTVVSEYRKNNIPLDCIVQDWGWWTAFGSFTWTTPFANPSTWISDLHASNAHLALSIWPTFVSGTPNYTTMTGHLITASCNTETAGYWMNAFDTTALRYFWGYMNANCLSAGVDAWWMDAVEPECEPLTNQTTSWGPIEEFSNAYSLSHAKNIYERQRAVSTDKRVVNLTRSFYAGQQRFATMYWNGDISGSDVKNIATTVSGGLNSCMAGNPYWCSDIGGFMNNPTDDILTRWFQAGTFFPIFRVHGSRPTEIYNMSAAVKPIAITFSKLRYRLMPYIYSLAWKVTNENYTMTRALPFDFPNDAGVRNIANQFMFGPALLVNPVTASGTSRSVYLPAGNWYDFWTGAVNTGTSGRNVTASVTIQTIPIYARAGAILPMGPRIQYATQSVDPMELRIYPGADGSFTLYEDEGDNYNYEKGTYATIPISYNNTTGRVTIGARNGTFPGMLANRTFNVVFVTPGHGIADTITANPDCIIAYNGTAVTGCPASGICRECATKKILRGQSFSLKTAEERVVFPAGFRDATKEITVYNLSGKLLGKSISTMQSFSLRKDFGLSNGSFFIKVRILQ